MNLVRRVQNLELLRQRLVPPDPVPFDQPADVLAVLAEQVQQVRGDIGADPVERGRTLVSLCAVALRAMESRDTEARLEAVERVLKLRKENERANDRLNKKR